MSLQHFYLETQVISTIEDSDFLLDLASEDYKHARVLRLQAPEHIAVIDAAQDYFECEIVSFDQEGLRVRIAQKLTSSAIPKLVLVQGLAKGEKMDTVFRHATELGVSGFIPFASKRSIVKLDAKKKASRLKRWQTIVKSAAAQSGQSRMPEVVEPVQLADLPSYLSQASCVLVCWEEAFNTKSLRCALESISVHTNQEKHAITQPSDMCKDAVVVVVGPEGGLAEEEVEALLAMNEQASLISLGPSILRTETAGVVAPALVLYELGGLQ